MPTKRKRVFISREIPEAGLEPLRAAAACDIWTERTPPPRDELLRRVEGCAGLVTLLSDRVDAELLDAAGPQLRVVSNYAVGVNNIDLPEARRRRIAVGNTPGVLTDATADIAVGLLVAAARRFGEATAAVRDGMWKTWEPRGLIGQDLAGKTLGIVGMGRIGSAVARRLYGGWAMRVLYTARRPKPELDASLAARHVAFDELLAESDFVSIHTDLNDQTRGMFDRRALARMKPSAVLVNTARGPIIDQDALVEALRTGEIFAAGLDVTDPEPLPPDHPLVALPKCLIVPHIGSATVTSRDAMARIAADNLLAGLEGRPLPHPVESERTTEDTGGPDEARGEGTNEE